MRKNTPFLSLRATIFMVISVIFALYILFSVQSAHALIAINDGIVGYVFPNSEWKVSTDTCILNDSSHPCGFESRAGFLCPGHNLGFNRLGQAIPDRHTASDPLCGTQSTNPLPIVSSVSEWLYNAGPSPQPTCLILLIFPCAVGGIYDVDYYEQLQMLANDRTLNVDNLPSDSILQNNGIRFFIIDLLRDENGKVIYHNTNGDIVPPCPPHDPFVPFVGDECKPYFIDKSGVKGFEPALATFGLGGGFHITPIPTDFVRPLYDYQLGSGNSVFEPKVHVYTTVPFKAGDPRLVHSERAESGLSSIRNFKSYQLNRIIGGIFIGGGENPSCTANAQRVGLCSSKILKSINEGSNHPPGTVPLYRYHVCRDPSNGEGEGLVTFIYRPGPILGKSLWISSVEPKLDIFKALVTDVEGEGSTWPLYNDPILDQSCPLP